MSTIFLASRSPRFWLEFSDTIEQTRGFQVGLCSRNAGELLRAARCSPPDLAVVDIDLPWREVCELTSRLARQSVAILIVGNCGTSEAAMELLARGACAFINRSESPESVLDVFRALLGEGLNPQKSRRLLQSMLASVCALESDSRWSTRDPDSERSEGYCHSALSRREREVVWLVADGRTNEEIAERLCISLRTAKNHMSNIMRKIGTRNRTELASIFWRNEMSRTASQQPSQSLRHAS